MQTWDLRVHTDGNWASARLRAVLPSGTFYRATSTGISMPQNTHQQREFWPYVLTVPGHVLVLLGRPLERSPVAAHWVPDCSADVPAWDRPGCPHGGSIA